MDRGILTNVMRTLVDLVCGARCIGCGTRGVTTPCPQCARALELLSPRRGATYPDTGVARRLVRAAKFGHWRDGGRLLGLHACSRLPNVPLDLVTWVPAERSRRARRGGHLPEVLARTWADELGISCLGLLRRERGSTQQGLDRAERRRNVAGVWHLARGLDARHLQGRRILLVDDVRTSGATLDAAGSLLEAFGASVERLAVVEHGTPNGARRPGGPPRARAITEIPARCEEFLLTTVSIPADSVIHERRKDAPGVRKPRPP